MSLVDAGVGRARGGGDRGGRRQFESSHSNIEHQREKKRVERAAALFLLVKRKLNRGGHGNREFALALQLRCARIENFDK